MTRPNRYSRIGGDATRRFLSIYAGLGLSTPEYAQQKLNFRERIEADY